MQQTLQEIKPALSFLLNIHVIFIRNSRSQHVYIIELHGRVKWHSGFDRTYCASSFKKGMTKVAYLKTEISCYINEKNNKNIHTVVVWIRALLIPVYVVCLKSKETGRVARELAKL